MDEWVGMSMDEIRHYEKQTAAALAQVCSVVSSASTFSLIC